MNRQSYSLNLLLGVLFALLATSCNLDPPKEVVAVRQTPMAADTIATGMRTPGLTAPVAEATTVANQKGTVYRIRTSFIGKSDVAFQVFLNDRQMGTFNTDAENDVTPSVKDGVNQVRVTWKNKPGTDPDNVARVFVESQRDGQDSWNTLFSREVTRESKDTESEGAFTVGPTP